MGMKKSLLFLPLLALALLFSPAAAEARDHRDGGGRGRGRYHGGRGRGGYRGYHGDRGFERREYQGRRRYYRDGRYYYRNGDDFYPYGYRRDRPGISIEF